MQVVCGTHDWALRLDSWAQYHKVPFVMHHKEAVEADLLVSVQYDRIFDRATLERYDRALNIHFSPLPYYRGVRPVNWALKNWERTHGVTIHEITPGIDDGPVVAQTTFTICPPVDEVADVYNRCEDEARLLFDATMRCYDHLDGVAQDESDATYYSKAESHLLGNREGWVRERENHGFSPNTVSV